MKSFLNGAVVANQIRLHRTNFSGSFLLLEGPSDVKFFKNLIDAERCKPIPANGREYLLECLEILNKEKFEGFLAIADSDHDRLEGTFPQHDNLLSYDDNDLEIMLIKSPALDRVLNEFASEAKAPSSVEVRKTLFRIALPIGCLRLLNRRKNLSLDFDGMNIRRFLDINSLELDRQELLRLLKSRSTSSISEADLLEMLREVEAEKHDPSQACNGHDAVEILAIGLHRKWGSKNNKAEDLEQALRLAYEFDFFRSTAIYTAIKERRFIILKESL